jgi:hypothetical protein
MLPSRSFQMGTNTINKNIEDLMLYDIQAHVVWKFWEFSLNSFSYIHLPHIFSSMEVPLQLLRYFSIPAERLIAQILKA